MARQNRKRPAGGSSGPQRPKRPAQGGGQPGAFRPKPKHGDAQADTTTRPMRAPRKGARPLERWPVMLETAGDDDYALLDSGDGQKLERYGPLTLVRPEQQAIWAKRLPAERWQKADAVFTGNTEEEGMGRWHFPQAQLAETWPMAFDGMPYLGRFTAFRHVGVFPEQAAHWRAMRSAIETAGRPVKVLNLFGYTGVASLVAAEAGAEVTHVDASKKAITFARENQDLAGLNDRPIRWICEDAMKFVEREGRRGNHYDIILTDPPAYGRGPGGEVWQLFDNLPAMLDGCRAILSPKPLMLVLTAYAIRASFLSMHEMMMDTMTGFAIMGRVESGELLLREGDGARVLSTSMFSRWLPAEAGDA